MYKVENSCTGHSPVSWEFYYAMTHGIDDKMACFKATENRWLWGLNLVIKVTRDIVQVASVDYGVMLDFTGSNSCPSLD